MGQTARVNVGSSPRHTYIYRYVSLPLWGRAGWGLFTIPPIPRRLPDLLKDPWFAGSVAAIGLAAGLVLWVVTLLVANSRISGNGWSLAGNGALIVPFGVGPAIVAGAWTAIILRMRGHRRWLQFGLASAVIGLILVVCSLLSLVLFGAGSRDAGATGSVFFGFLLYGWLLASAVASAM